MAFADSKVIGHVSQGEKAANSVCIVLLHNT